MLRSATSTLAKRAMQQVGSASRTNNRVPPPAFRVSSQFFHSSSRVEQSTVEEEAPVVEEPKSEGINPAFAIPVGLIAAVPILEFQWYQLEEATLAGLGCVTFCVVVYTQFGDMIKKLIEDESASIMKIQNEAEDAVIAELESQLAFLDLTANIEQDAKDVVALTKASYEKLNAAGAIKPKHDLKAQVEKMLGMITNEEQNVYSKAKTAMMEEATTSVMESFLSDDKLKKAALENALAKLTGKASKGGDPVQQAYMDFFAAKKAEAAKVDEAAESAEARAALLTKMNGLAEAEGMMFRFDSSGKPALV